MINIIEKSGAILSSATQGNPALSVFCVVLFYLLFSVLEATVEKLIFGERFEHWLDPFFIAGFIAYAGYSVYACAVFNSR